MIRKKYLQQEFLLLAFALKTQREFIFPRLQKFRAKEGDPIPFYDLVFNQVKSKVYPWQ
jgi:hypothetical protein